jgi:NADH-quinone oxidoreductase subunit M
MNLGLMMVGALASGLVSLLALNRLRRVQWALFFATVAFLAWGAWRLVAAGSGPQAFSAAGLRFGVTPLGGLFVAASSAVTLLIALFSLSYNDGRHATGIAPLWTLLMAANLGIFTATDWIAFLVSWEAMGFLSFFIIAHGEVRSFRAALYYYAISLVGTAGLLAAIFLAAGATGSFDIAASIAALRALWASRPGFVTLIAGLLVLAFAAKSAIGPFYMWPARAHAEAPDDFSAFLSGVMIKYGVYGLLLAVVPLFGEGYVGPAVRGVPLFLAVLGWIGAFTAVWATLLAIRENDMKRLMAYSTVSNIGFITIALSTATWFGAAAAVFQAFNHMAFKAAIFLSMGAVKFRTGEREMHRLGGMAYRMPLTFFAFLLGIIAAAGIPPMSGFASKWMVFQSLFQRKLLLLAVPAFFASTGGFLYLYRGMHSIYLGQLSPRFARVKEAPPLQSLAMVLLMIAVYAVGTFPGLVLLPLNRAIVASGGRALDVSLRAITGVTSRIDLGVVSLVFLASFAATLVLYLLGKRRTAVAPLDTYTSGEDPADWAMTPEQYHYAYHFYEPFEKMTAPALARVDFERWYSSLHRTVTRLGGALGRALDGPRTGAFLFTGALLVALFVGIMA